MKNDLDLLNRSEAEEIAIKSNVDKEHIEYFKNTYIYNISTCELDSEFYLWQKKACEYDPYIIWCDNIPDKIKGLSSFIKKADSYKYDYNLFYIISQTVRTPSLLLSYIGLSENWLTRILDVASSIFTLYNLFAKFLLPILKSQGLL